MPRRFPGRVEGESKSVGPEFTNVEQFSTAGSHIWTPPPGIKGRILVHVWGAGGAGGNDAEANAYGHGGGGGGLAVKYINVGSLGATETLTIGAGATSRTGIGGTSSFGSHCSATGGNSGHNNTANEGSAAEYGVGGLGVGGDFNKRGGEGGNGYWNTATNTGGGGGGSAPAPYGRVNGYRGGHAVSTRSAGGGGGIGGNGGLSQTNCGAGGGGSAEGAQTAYPGIDGHSPGGSGLMAPGGVPTSTSITYTNHSHEALAHKAQSGALKGGCKDFILEPNLILFGGGGGAGSTSYVQSSAHNMAFASSGGPGGGGGGMSHYGNQNLRMGQAGAGGILGGGGGACNANFAGRGGNAGGGGGAGYNPGAPANFVQAYHGYGGDGLIIIQYKIK